MCVYGERHTQRDIERDLEEVHWYGFAFLKLKLEAKMLRNKDDLSMLPIKAMIYGHLSQTTVDEYSEYDQVLGNKVVLLISILV